MSRSDHGSPAHFTLPSHSHPISEVRSIDQNLVTHVKPRSTMATVTLNVLFLGETVIGECSIIDIIAGPRARKRTRHASRRAPGNDMHKVTLGGKTFKLHALHMNESVAPVALREGIQNTLTDLCGNGGVHLLVYCMRTSHPTLWVHEIHRTITSNLAVFPRISIVAVVAGMSDVVQQESWWSSNEDVLANLGLHFDDHTFIQVVPANTRSPTRGHISECRRVLHDLILQNSAFSLNSESDSDTQRVASYRQRSIGNTFQSLFSMSTGKSFPHTLVSSKSINIVLLGEIGVGKSSLINLITKEKVAEVSSDTIGCTKTTARYTFEGMGRTFNLYDTPGLVDPQMGVNPFVDPIDIIQRLILSLGGGNGPNLLLFCIDNSKPTVALRRNYRLFCKIICEGKVPSVLAITKLEEDRGADQWWSQHEATFRSYGIECSGHVGIGHEKRHLGHNLEPLRESLLSSFVICADRHWRKYRTSSQLFSIGRILGSMTLVLRSQPSTLESTLMIQCELEERTARELANRIVSSRQSYGYLVDP